MGGLRFNYDLKKLKHYRDWWLQQGHPGRRLAGYLLLGLVLLKLVAWLVPLPRQAVAPTSAVLVFDRNEQLLRAFTAPDGRWRIRTKLRQISPELRRFLIAYEDQSFYWHPGVNPRALVRAYRQNLAAGRIVSGGSTITMQIARMIEPKPRTWYNKLFEMLRAVQLEQRYSKRRLLEIYFNIAPYGGNIEGVAAASWLYLGKEPTQLSYAEAALLAAIPNSPTKLRPDLDPDRARAARDQVLGLLYRRGLIKQRDYQEALAEEVPRRRLELPFAAPHLCQELKRDYPEESRIYSTLSQPIQLLCEDLLRAQVHRLQAEGISNGAVVVIDNQRREVLAAVGSVDFFNREDQGEVNGVLAPRSPGSALKPFVYMLGFEQGVITPRHYLEDVPIDFQGGYAPENFDRQFNGIVSAQEALERSLNVPAINLLLQLSEEERLYELLRRVNSSTINPHDNYGLTIALGGCEVNLLELTALYTALANQGQYQLPRLRRNQAQNPTIGICSPGASFLVTSILAELRRPDLPACWEFTALPRIAWKTGTSYGHRDAWTIGYNPRYTVGVWIGNFSGEGRAGLTGVDVAAPLLFDIFNQIAGPSQPWFRPPVTVETRQVCAISGQLPGPYCQTKLTELYLTDRTQDQTCRFHQVYQLDSQTGYRLPPHYYSVRSTREQIYIKWPPRVAAWMEANGYPVDRIPALLPEWQQLLPGQAPVIRSPSPNYLYQIREGIDLEFQKIALEAAAANDVAQLYWFIDGQLIGTVKPGQKFFYRPRVGTHRLVCQDDQGRSTAIVMVIAE